MYNLFNKFIIKNVSTIIIAVFILMLPLIINIHISDMVLSIRYLSLSILIFSLFLFNFKNGIITDVLKNPIFISLLLLLCINIVPTTKQHKRQKQYKQKQAITAFLQLILSKTIMYIKQNRVSVNIEFPKYLV